MYNENIKLNYIATRPESMQANYKNFFIASGKKEEKLGKDIACFTKDELAEYFESLGESFPKKRTQNRIKKPNKNAEIG